MVMDGGKQIQGTLQVAGVVDGPIILKATQLNVVPDNHVLELDGNDDSAVIPDLTDLSGDAITVVLDSAVRLTTRVSGSRAQRFWWWDGAVSTSSRTMESTQAFRLERTLTTGIGTGWR